MNPSEFGYINKIEPFGTVDGPGIRTIVFLSGCPLRCLYCHNPETWQANTGKGMTPQELLEIVLRYKPYYGTNGGVTFSGGEPLNQPEFLLACLKLLKQEGIHTTLDTSGYSTSKHLPAILALVDLVIFDLKAADEVLYQRITSRKMDVSEKFLALAQELGTNLWIRQVLVSGLNDTEMNFETTAQKLSKLRYVTKIEILPYHTLGKTKYEKLEMDYPLKDTPPMPIGAAEHWQKRLLERIRDIHEES